MTDRLLERLCAIGIGIAPDFPAGEILVDWELVLEAIRRIEAQNAEIERLRNVITAWADIQDEIDDLWTSRSPDDFEYTLPDLEKEEREACEALRKAVGR